MPALQSFQTTVGLVCPSYSPYSLQALWHVAVRLLSAWGSRNSHHQTWLYLGHTASQHNTGARQPKASSDNKNVAMPARAGKPAESPGLGTMALVKVAEEVRDLGTRGKGKGGLERAVCPVSLTEQPSSSDGIKPHRAPGWFKLFSKAESWDGRMGIRTTRLIPSNHLQKREMPNRRARSTSTTGWPCLRTDKLKALTASHP